MVKFSDDNSAMTSDTGLVGLVHRAIIIVQWIAVPSVTQLALRLALSTPFWRSGVKKWDGFLQLDENTIYLFASEFKLHLPGGPYDYPVPAVMAFLSGSAEITFPILLVLGLATRFAALGLFVMTIVVQITVPSGWPVHLTWAAMALALMAWGPGKLSFDHAIGVMFRSPPR